MRGLAGCSRRNGGELQKLRMADLRTGVFAETDEVLSAVCAARGRERCLGGHMIARGLKFVLGVLLAAVAVIQTSGTAHAISSDCSAINTTFSGGSTQSNSGYYYFSLQTGEVIRYSIQSSAGTTFSISGSAVSPSIAPTTSGSGHTTVTGSGFALIDFSGGGSMTATVTCGVANDAGLSSLSLSQGTLAPAFASNTTSYTVPSPIPSRRSPLRRRQVTCSPR